MQVIKEYAAVDVRVVIAGCNSKWLLRLFIRSENICAHALFYTHYVQNAIKTHPSIYPLIFTNCCGDYLWTMNCSWNQLEDWCFVTHRPAGVGTLWSERHGRGNIPHTVAPLIQCRRNPCCYDVYTKVCYRKPVHTATSGFCLSLGDVAPCGLMLL